MNTRIGVVTVTYNSCEFLDDFLRSLDAQQYKDWHCWIIDNNSRDETLAVLHSRNLDPQKYTIIPSERNLGVAAGNNIGILRAIGQGCGYALLLNNDTTFPPDLLGHLLSAAIERGWPAVVPKIHFNTPPGTIWYGGGGFNPRRGYTGYHVGFAETDIGQHDKSSTVDYSPTCCMLIERKVFETIGLMDESYFVYFDDTDFCWRMKQRAVPLGYAAECVLIHKVGGSTGGVESPFVAHITARNRLYFLRKHFGKFAPLKWMPVFVPYYLFRYLMKSWKPRALLASLRGTLEYGKMRECVPALPAQASGRK